VLVGLGVRFEDSQSIAGVFQQEHFYRVGPFIKL
jgi:hypothetical protein